jgi:hypothetical protein
MRALHESPETFWRLLPGAASGLFGGCWHGIFRSGSQRFLRVGGDFLRLLVLRGFPLSAPLPIPAPVTNANCE